MFKINGLEDIQVGNVNCQSCNEYNNDIKVLTICDDIYIGRAKKGYEVPGFKISLCKKCRQNLRNFLASED